jgi:glycosyltransferase involved in cell wall biosynthesis
VVGRAAYGVWYERAVAPTSRPSVAVDVTPLLGHRTGIGYAVAETLEALAALEAAPSLVPYTLSLRARQHRSELPPETRFVPVPARVLLRSWTRAEGPRIDRWLRPANVLHATNYLAPPSALPTLVSVYDCSFVRYPELCTPEVRAFAPILERAIARGVTVHTTSEFVAAEIEERFGRGLQAAGRLVVIPLGVPAIGSVSEWPPNLDPALAASPFVLAIGAIEPRKNLPHLVGAFGALAADHPDLHLVVAGPDGPARPHLDAAIARLEPPARARVVVAGPVSDEGRRALLGAATLLAYPSIYEGFGFPVLEAMSADVPVVAARAGAVPEVAGDAALLAEPTDEAALAAAIDRVLRDEHLRAELVARGRDRLRAFSWSDTARALAACYRRLAGGR